MLSTLLLTVRERADDVGRVPKNTREPSPVRREGYRRIDWCFETNILEHMPRRHCKLSHIHHIVSPHSGVYIFAISAAFASRASTFATSTVCLHFTAANMTAW